MKILKRVLVSVMCFCMLLSGMTLNVFAAEGSIAFTDPDTAVGEMVDVKCVVSASADSISSVNLTLSYDSTALSFESGEGVTKSQDGTLVYNGQGGEGDVTFTMTFQALKEEATVISIASASVVGSSGYEMELEEGNSTVSIAAGDPSKIKQKTTSETQTEGAGVSVDVNGVSYELASDFADQDIPAGYKRAKVTYEGAERNMVVNESETIYLAYLISSEGESDFFYYDSNNAKFSPYEEIDISDSTSIVILSETGLSLPDTYEQTTLTLNGKEFPIWQDTENPEYYVVYAVNTDGEKSLYRYDSQEETYQRFEAPDQTEVEDPETTDTDSFFGKLQNIVDRFFKIIVILIGVLFFILLIILIVTKVKLRNRDLELDELYDEYGIDLDDEEEEEIPVAVKKKNKNKKNEPAVRKPQKTAKMDLEEDFDDYGELDYEDDFDEDDFEDFEDFEDDYDDYDDEMDDSEDLIDDLDELLSQQPKKRRSHQEMDDTFQVDFIDLD